VAPSRLLSLRWALSKLLSDLLLSHQTELPIHDDPAAWYFASADAQRPDGQAVNIAGTPGRFSNWHRLVRCRENPEGAGSLPMLHRAKLIDEGVVVGHGAKSVLTVESGYVTMFSFESLEPIENMPAESTGLTESATIADGIKPLSDSSGKERVAKLVDVDSPKESNRCLHGVQFIQQLAADLRERLQDGDETPLLLGSQLALGSEIRDYSAGPIHQIPPVGVTTIGHWVKDRSVFGHFVSLRSSRYFELSSVGLEWREQNTLAVGPDCNADIVALTHAGQQR
jgi:hypothetical protein